MPLIGRDKLEKAIDDKVSELNKSLISIYATGLRNIVEATPVHFDGGGRLKNNWFLTVSSASSKTRGGQASGSSSLAQIGSLPGYVLGKKIYFTNNLPYAGIVEYGGYPSPPKDGTWTGTKFEKLSSGGYSKQAPSGMTRINVNKMIARIKAL